MKKVLVLSCGTGGGHNSAAKAIVENLKEKGIQADFSEYMDIVNPKIKETVNNLYIKSTIGNGKIFKGVYKIGEFYDKTTFVSPVYALNSLGKRRLYNYIKENNYKYMVVTHLFPALALTSIKKEHDIHFMEIATDYVYIPFWKETKPDYIIIPHNDLIEDFKYKGIDKKVIKPIGIPVSTSFSEKIDKEKCLKELGLESDKKYILVMTGSMGFGNIEYIVDRLNKRFEETIIVICGNNKKLYKKLEKKRNSKLILLGFTNEIYKYMKISEIILTKPGGLTTTEAATINIPIIHTMPIPGCENYNADFFEKRGMSIICNTITEIEDEVYNIIGNKDLKDKMIKNQQKHIDKKTTDKICDFIINEIMD